MNSELVKFVNSTGEIDIGAPTTTTKIIVFGSITNSPYSFGIFDTLCLFLIFGAAVGVIAAIIGEVYEVFKTK